MSPTRISRIRSWRAKFASISRSVRSTAEIRSAACPASRASCRPMTCSRDSRALRSAIRTRRIPGTSTSDAAKSRSLLRSDSDARDATRRCRVLVRCSAMPLESRRVRPELSDPLRHWCPNAIRTWLLVLACIAVPGTSAHAQHADPRDLGPSQEPLFSLDSPLGSIDYVAGRGLHLGSTGLTVGGFTTVELNRDAGGPAFLDLDGVNFLVLWEPVDFFTAFAELEVGDLFSLNLDDGHVASDVSFQAERLYGDLSWNDALNGRLGKFQTPVGIWNLVPAEPFTWTATDPVLVETAFDEHQTGGALYGTFYPGSQTLEYWIYGQFFDPLDPSDTPAPANHGVGGRLRYAGELDDWAVGASYLSSQRDGRWNYLGGLDAFWKVGRVELQSEF